MHPTSCLYRPTTSLRDHRGHHHSGLLHTCQHSQPLVAGLVASSNADAHRAAPFPGFKEPERSARRPVEVPAQHTGCLTAARRDRPSYQRCAAADRSPTAVLDHPGAPPRLGRLRRRGCRGHGLVGRQLAEEPLSASLPAAHATPLPPLASPPLPALLPPPAGTRSRSCRSAVGCEPLWAADNLISRPEGAPLYILQGPRRAASVLRLPGYDQVELRAVEAAPIGGMAPAAPASGPAPEVAPAPDSQPAPDGWPPLRRVLPWTTRLRWTRNFPLRPRRGRDRVRAAPGRPTRRHRMSELPCRPATGRPRRHHRHQRSPLLGIGSRGCSTRNGRAGK